MQSPFRVVTADSRRPNHEQSTSNPILQDHSEDNLSRAPPPSGFLERGRGGAVVQGYVDAGYAPPGVMAEGPDGAAYFGNHHVLVASHHADDARVVLTSEQFKVLLRHILTTMDHPAYNDPGPKEEDPFEPVTIEIIAFGQDSLGEYYKRGGVTPVIPEEYR